MREIETGSAAGMVPGLRQVAPRLLVAGVLPVVGYTLLRPHVGSDAVALAAVAAFPVADISVERARHGRLDPIGIIVLIGIAAGLLGAVLLRGNTTLLKVRESLVTGVFGLVCLATLAARRPAMFHLGRAFATAGDPERAADFDARWALPGVPRRFRAVTAVWGVTLVVEASVRIVLALGVSTQRFLEFSPIISWSVLGGLLWFTRAFARQSERRLAAAAGAVAGPNRGA